MDYGCDRDDLAAWYVESPWERYHYNGGIELVALMLDYYSFTNNITFLQETLIPFATSIKYLRNLLIKRLRYSPVVEIALPIKFARKVNHYAFSSYRNLPRYILFIY